MKTATLPPRDQIEKLYQQWWNKTGNGITDPVQIREMRRAFWAGVMAFFQYNLVEICALADDDAEAHLRAVTDELERYGKRVLGGQE